MHKAEPYATGLLENRRGARRYQWIALQINADKSLVLPAYPRLSAFICGHFFLFLPSEGASSQLGRRIAVFTMNRRGTVENSSIYDG
jgi:hypothetical protein